MSNNFRVGQKVVCVAAGFIPGFGGGKWGKTEGLCEGRVYTVTSVHRDDYGDVVLWLDEVSRDAMSKKLFGDKCGYAIQRFRPAVDKPASIEVFRKMLTPEKADA